jgi:hypothetical protein
MKGALLAILAAVAPLCKRVNPLGRWLLAPPATIVASSTSVAPLSEPPP